MSRAVAERQNEDRSLLLARAFRRRYAMGRRWRALRLGVGIAFGSLGVLLGALVPDTGPYIAAGAGAWTLLSRGVFALFERKEQDRGASAQEMFDTYIFGLPWNATAAGRKPAPEDVRCWAEKEPESGLRDWYPRVDDARRPLNVLVCQRSSVIWARQDHAAYALMLRVVVACVLLASVVVGVAVGLGLGEYLLQFGLPVLPAALDVLEIANANGELSRRRGQIEDDVDAVLADAATNGTLPPETVCRRLQDAIYTTRRLAGVPGWFYKLTRERRERNMHDAAREQVDALPANLKMP